MEFIFVIIVIVIVVAVLASAGSRRNRRRSGGGPRCTCSLTPVHTACRLIYARLARDDPRDVKGANHGNIGRSGGAGRRWLVAYRAGKRLGSRQGFTAARRRKRRRRVRRR